jgi:hypothetical protein
MARYTVAQYSIYTLLGWVKSGEIAIPEIQRPFIWESVQVRDLLVISGVSDWVSYYLAYA